MRRVMTGLSQLLTTNNGFHVYPAPPLKATNSEWSDPVGAGEWTAGIKGAWPPVGLPASETHVMLPAGLPFAAAYYSQVSAVTAAGAKPSWWPDIVELANNL